MNRLPDNYGIEQKRLQFLMDRDGPEATLVFAIQTMKIYRHAFFARDKEGHKLYVHLKEHRRGFLESIVAFKRYIAANSVDFYSK
jgi:hypothetical protein